jgi:hypothetical protein
VKRETADFEGLRLVSTSLWDEIQAVINYQGDNPRPNVVTVGVVAEHVSHWIGSQSGIWPERRQSAESFLITLEENLLIPKYIGFHFHRIRESRNKVAHTLDKGPKNPDKCLERLAEISAWIDRRFGGRAKRTNEAEKFAKLVLAPAPLPAIDQAQTLATVKEAPIGASTSDPEPGPPLDASDEPAVLTHFNNVRIASPTVTPPPPSVPKAPNRVAGLIACGVLIAVGCAAAGAILKLRSWHMQLPWASDISPPTTDLRTLPMSSPDTIPPGAKSVIITQNTRSSWLRGRNFKQLNYVAYDKTGKRADDSVFFECGHSNSRPPQIVYGRTCVKAKMHHLLWFRFQLRNPDQADIIVRYWLGNFPSRR